MKYLTLILLFINLININAQTYGNQSDQIIGWITLSVLLFALVIGLSYLRRHRRWSTNCCAHETQGSIV